MKVKKMEKRNGFTLTELAISLFIAGTVVVAAFFFMADQLRAYKNTRMVLETQEGVRNGIDFVVNDLKMAGYGIGKEHAIRYYDTGSSQTIYSFSAPIKSDSTDESAEPYDSLVLVRSFGDPYSIVRYNNASYLDESYDDTDPPSEFLCLCGDVKDNFLFKSGSTTDYLDATLFNATGSDYMSVSILKVLPYYNLSPASCGSGKLAMNCSSVVNADPPTTNPPPETWTEVKFKPKPITSSSSIKQQEMGMRKSVSSVATEYVGGYLYPNLRVIAYTVSNEELTSSSWKNSEKRAILWRDDGAGPQAVAEDVVGFQVDFENDVNATDSSVYGRRISNICYNSSDELVASKYALPGFLDAFGKNVCGIKSHHAIVTLVTRVKDEDEKGVVAAAIKLPVGLSSPSGGNLDDRCYPNCDDGPDKIKRRAIVRHVIMGNKL